MDYLWVTDGHETHLDLKRGVGGWEGVGGVVHAAYINAVSRLTNSIVVSYFYAGASVIHSSNIAFTLLPAKINTQRKCNAFSGQKIKCPVTLPTTDFCRCNCNFLCHPAPK